ncbi:BRO-N domain-containing protein [Cupriavidus pinatubonensis]|nr:BRO family protein [Cupriavidus pinatubonensis]
MHAVKIIHERDMYRLVLRSKLPADEKFEKWVVAEVLPSIHKTGRYQATHDQTPGWPSQVATAHGVRVAQYLLPNDHNKGPNGI